MVKPPSPPPRPRQLSVPFIGEHISGECRHQKHKWFGNFWPSWLDKMGEGSVLTFGEGSHHSYLGGLFYTVSLVLLSPGTPLTCLLNCAIPSTRQGQLSCLHTVFGTPSPMGGNLLQVSVSSPKSVQARQGSPTGTGGTDRHWWRRPALVAHTVTGGALPALVAQCVKGLLPR